MAAQAGADPTPRRDWSGFFIGGNLDFRNGAPVVDAPISLHVGRDMQYGDAVFGGELEISDADAGAPGNNITFMTRAKLRSGQVVGETLYYVTAGAVRSESIAGPAYGVLAGVGAEFAIAKRWRVGAELLHHHFPDYRGNGSHNVQTVSARISYRF